MSTSTSSVTAAKPQLLAVTDPAAWIARRAKRISRAFGTETCEATIEAIQNWARFVPEHLRTEVRCGVSHELL
jgi:hypothetical protein